MRQLQADVQVAIGLRAEALAVRSHQFLAQRRQGRLRGRCDQQLIRIGTAVVPDRHGLAAPNQLGAAPPEVPPAPARQFARLAARRAVPALHRQDAEPVADRDAVDGDGLGERRAIGRRKLIVEFERNGRPIEMRAKRRRRLERRDPRIGRLAHDRFVLTD